jgi:hypothetical protein
LLLNAVLSGILAGIPWKYPVSSTKVSEDERVPACEMKDTHLWGAVPFIFALRIIFVLRLFEAILHTSGIVVVKQTWQQNIKVDFVERAAIHTIQRHSQ